MLVAVGKDVVGGYEKLTAEDVEVETCRFPMRCGRRSSMSCNCCPKSMLRDSAAFFHVSGSMAKETRLRAS